jgi:dienelactone hydrolase
MTAMIRLGLLVSALVAALMTGTAAADDVRVAEYELTPGLPAVVHHPTGGGAHPLVLMLHGHFASCADADGEYADQFRWPCAAGIDPIPSYRGYDYLGRSLAQQGFVVVSINANDINGGKYTGDDFAARAARINEHLRAWQELSASGPLAKFAGLKVDMTNVGVLGHSKGGRAVAEHSSDAFRNWPAGVRVRAAVALEPIPSGGSTAISDIPFMTVIGACDRVSNPAARQYFEDSGRNNTAPLHLITVPGANHNFFNTTWSPSSGEVNARDDAPHDGVAPGNCRTTDASQAEQKQLTEAEQRRVGDGYLTAFFQRYLKEDRRFDPLLTGAEHPFGPVEVETD